MDLTHMLDIRHPVENLMMGMHCVVKEFIMPAGSTIEQHKHKYPHAAVLVSGRVIVSVPESKYLPVVEGPYTLVLEPHINHSIKAVTDAVWLCIHPDNEEAKWIEP